MPRSIFSRSRSSNVSRCSRVSQKHCTLLTKAFKDVAKRFIICYRSLCCFPLDQIVPSNHRKFKTGLKFYLRPAVNQTSQKILPDLKIIHVLPRSRVSFYDPARAKSEMTAAQIENELATDQTKSGIATTQVQSEIATTQVQSEIATTQVKSETVTAKKVKSDVSRIKKVKSNVSSSKKIQSKVSFEKQIANIFIDKVKKISRTRLFKEKGKKFFDYGSDSIKSTFKNRKKSNASFRNTDKMKAKKKSKNDVHENRWSKTKRIIRNSNPGNMKWRRHLKPRNMATSSTDNEESAGDSPATPKLSRDNKVPLRWKMVQAGFIDTETEFFNSDIDKKSSLKSSECHYLCFQ